MRRIVRNLNLSYRRTLKINWYIKVIRWIAISTSELIIRIRGIIITTIRIIRIIDKSIIAIDRNIIKFRVNWRIVIIKGRIIDYVNEVT